ncbi:MAG: metal-dependent hydrolase [Gammaproteobacteria bacterium]|nr:metal-dependent hydrolase [Gammaproteobacteria bacterium]
MLSRNDGTTAMRLNTLLSSIAISLLCQIALAAQSPYATTVIMNGKVITADADDVDAISFAEAIAIREDEIIAVGSNEDMRQYVADWTETIDAKGNTVLPGLIDTHNHL